MGRTRYAIRPECVGTAGQVAESRILKPAETARTRPPVELGRWGFYFCFLSLFTRDPLADFLVFGLKLFSLQPTDSPLKNYSGLRIVSRDGIVSCLNPSVPGHLLCVKCA